MIIIPFKLSWDIEEINSILAFAENGGLVYLTKYVPKEILDVEIKDRVDYYLQPSELIKGGMRLMNKVYYNYYKAFRSLSFGYFPSEDPMSLSYISKTKEEVEVIHFASVDSLGNDVIGNITITKKLGSGRITFTSTSIFDVLGQRAIGGPILDHTIVGTKGSGHANLPMINYMIMKQFLMEDIFIPLLWHTPYGKLGVLMSRDDVDRYYESAVETRGNVDRSHNIPTIFYELRDDIPVDKWDSVLDRDSNNQTYHFAGYHRHTNYEYTNDSYLDRVLDIETETGLPVYFECHHGAGSGFFAQNYVRTAVEATNQLDHPVVYTSSEGGHGNQYLEPYLYRDSEGKIIPAKNYYAFPKSNTIDTEVNTNDVQDFRSYINKNLFQTSEHIHYLLHSQNVKSTMTTNYHQILSKTIDYIYSDLYTDPVNFILLTLNNANNVSAAMKISSNSIPMSYKASNDIEGYSIKIPMSSDYVLSDVTFDNQALNLADMQYLLDGDGYRVIFYVNMTEGMHDLVINYQLADLSFPHDGDGDFIMDKYEVLLETDPDNPDNDNDQIVDGLELFRYGTDPFKEDSDGDGMPDGWEINNGLNPVSDDGTGDMDNDGVSNIDEYLNGFDPQKKDSDGDGIDDFTELHGTTYSLPTSNSDLPSDLTTDESPISWPLIMLIPVLSYLKKRKSNI